MVVIKNEQKNTLSTIVSCMLFPKPQRGENFL